MWEREGEREGCSVVVSTVSAVYHSQVPVPIPSPSRRPPPPEMQIEVYPDEYFCAPDGFDSEPEVIRGPLRNHRQSSICIASAPTSPHARKVSEGVPEILMRRAQVVQTRQTHVKTNVAPRRSSFFGAAWSKVRKTSIFTGPLLTEW
eukprot:965363_1